MVEAAVATGSGRRRWIAAALLLCCGVAALPNVAFAQDPLVEALMLQRQEARTAEVLQELGFAAEAFGPEEIVVDRAVRRRVSPSMPSLRMPGSIELPPLNVRPKSRFQDDADPEPMVLDQIVWRRVAPGEADRFILRFEEVLWTNAGRLARTDLDTMGTPLVRAHLHATFGAPTRTPVARGRPEMLAGSGSVQFEYWFVVNDEIPFVVMDRDGPFANGVLMVASEEHEELLGQLVADFARRVLAAPALMPYVDYYHASERNQWYRTGFDGTDFYTIETDRPRWARRSRDGGRWYEFR